jgi:nitroreductase
MNISESIKKKRTIRLYKQKKISYKILEDCVDSARLSSSARNAQPLEYIIIDDEKILKNLLPFIRFGGFITEDKKAKPGFEPTALIIILVKKGFEQYSAYDVGIAAQNISLVAFENKIGTCMMGAIDKENIKKELKVPDSYLVDLVITLGYPAEKPLVEEKDQEPRYERKNDIFYVYKKELKKVLHRNLF